MAQRTAVAQIEQALIDKEYHRGNEIDAKRTSSMGTKFAYWLKGDQTILVEHHHDGGCEVYAPVTKSLAISDTIASIP